MKKYKKLIENIELGVYDPNAKGYNNGKKIGFYGQNQENIDTKKVFDFRKNLEFSHDSDINDKNHIDYFYVNAKDSLDNILDKIAKWVCDKILCNVNSLGEGFEKVYWFLLNNNQEIYEVFGKSLSDDERKIVLLKAIDIFNNTLKDALINDIVNNHNIDLMEFGLKNGLTLNEAYTKIMERAPKNPKAERFIKKNKAEFKKRYGDRWEEVLYATAWKKFGESEESNNNNSRKIKRKTKKKSIV